MRKDLIHPSSYCASCRECLIGFVGLKATWRQVSSIFLKSNAVGECWPGRHLLTNFSLRLRSKGWGTSSCLLPWETHSLVRVARNVHKRCPAETSSNYRLFQFCQHSFSFKEQRYFCSHILEATCLHFPLYKALTNVFALSETFPLERSHSFPLHVCCTNMLSLGASFYAISKNFWIKIDILLSNQFLIQTEMRFLLRCWVK